jgi:protein SCO1/2
MVGLGVATLKRNFILIFCLSLLVACGEPEMPSPYHAKDVTWRHLQADFHLVDHNGKARSLTDFRGKVVVIFFGYTHCPEVCPTTLADLAQVLRKLGKDADKVQVLFVTLDPERDSPTLLASYVPYFEQSFLGLYGDQESTEKAAKSFGVIYQKQSNGGGGYTLDHSDSTYLIGATGQPLLLSPYGQQTELILSDIKLLLATGH